MFLWTGHFAQRPNEKPNRTVIHESKLTPLPNDKFKAVPALDKELSDGVSFQYPRKNGWFLTIKDDNCLIEPKRRTTNYERASSFFPLANFWYNGYTVFESSLKSGWYLRIKDSKLMLDRYDGSDEFKKEASFQVTKRPGTISSNGELRPLISQSSNIYCACSICESQSEIFSQPSTYHCCKDCECSLNNNNLAEDAL